MDLKTIVLLTFFTFVQGTFLPYLAGGQELPEFKHHVKVRVTADKNILGPITSHIQRELTSLGDVEVVDGDHAWILEITTIGPGMYVLILKKFHDQSRLNEAAADDLYHIKGRWLGRLSKESLQQTCSNIVRRFNQEHLEEERNTNEIFWDSLGTKGKNKVTP